MSMFSDVVENVRSHFGSSQQTGKLDTLCRDKGIGTVLLDKPDRHHFASFDELTEGWTTAVKKCGGQTHPKGVGIIILEMESVGDILHIKKLRLA